MNTSLTIKARLAAKSALAIENLFESREDNSLRR
jgi:hypothetical protein